MNEHVEKRRQEEQRQEEVELQKKQLFAQRVAAAAAVASAVNTAQTAEAVEQMRREASAAAEATARHQRVLEIQQAEMALRQAQMAHEQWVTNFRQTILTTLPLLKEEEKPQYLIEQLMQMVEVRYVEEKSHLHFSVILKTFKFSEFAQNFFAIEPDVKKFMIEGKNPKQKLANATDGYNKAKKELEAEERMALFAALFLALIAAGVAIFAVFLCLYYLCKSLFPDFEKYDNMPTPFDAINNMGTWCKSSFHGFANDFYSYSTTDNTCFAAILLGSLAAFVIILIIVKKSISTARAKKTSDLSTKLLVLKSEMDRETEAFDIWSKNHPDAWKKIKTKLVDSYLASDAGKKLLEFSMFNMLMFFRMECVAAEQAFLPPSARPSDEQWHAALKPRVEPEAELAKQRQSKIRDILLSRLVPNYETQQYDMADLDEKFTDLDLERPDATPEEPMSDKEVDEAIATCTKSIELSGQSEEFAAVKKIAQRELDSLRAKYPEKFT